MLSFQDPVEIWLSRPLRTSSKASYRQTFAFYCRLAEKTPLQLVELAKNDLPGAKNLISMVTNRMVKDGFSPARYSGVYATVRSFYKANGIDLGEYDTSYKRTVRYEGDRVFSPEEIARMVDVATTVRDKAIVLFLVQSGQRVNILHALKIHHVKEALKDGAKGPYVVEIPEFLSDNKGENCNKQSVKYRFPFGEDAANYLRLMTNERRRDGEQITDESWLFRSYAVNLAGMDKGHHVIKVKKNTQGEPITAAAINAEIIRKIAVSTGLQKFVETKRRTKNGAIIKRGEIHPHAFRRNLKHWLREAGVYDNEFMNFIIGHKIAYGGAYDKFPAEYIKREYLKAEPFLGLQKARSSYEDTNANSARSARLAAKQEGIPIPGLIAAIDEAYEENKDRSPDEFEIILNQVIKATYENLRRSLNEKISVELTRENKTVKTSPKRVRINSEELDSSLANGYKPIFNLPSGELVVEFAG